MLYRFYLSFGNLSGSRGASVRDRNRRRVNRDLSFVEGRFDFSASKGCTGGTLCSQKIIPIAMGLLQKLNNTHWVRSLETYTLKPGAYYRLFGDRQFSCRKWYALIRLVAFFLCLR